MPHHTNQSAENENNEILTCTLKVSSKIKKKTPVFLSEFSNGRLDVSKTPSIHFEPFRSTDDKKRNLIAKTDRLTYSGISTSNDHMQNFVGVLNKRTGKMKLFSSVSFKMKPILNTDLLREEKVSSSAKSYWDSRTGLTSEFGSKKLKRTMTSLHNASVTDSTISESVLSAESVSLLETSIDTPSTEDIDYLPPVNRQATIREEVFNIHDVISISDFDALGAEVESWSTKEFCNYVKVHEANLTSLSPDKMKYLIYLNYLIRFQHLTYVSFRKKDPDPSIPNPFKQTMLSMFTLVPKNGVGNRSFPPRLKDKILAYIIVLALMIDDFSFNAALLHKELHKIAMTKLVTVAQALGCHVRSLANEKYIVLSIPLSVMPTKSKRKSGGKMFR